MQRTIKWLWIALIVLVLLPLAARAENFETTANNAILIDADSGAVLYEKAADVRMPTSSMSKVITMAVVFDAIKAGKLKLDDMLPVSQTAWATQGSKMFVELGNSIKVEDLVRGVIIQSGNDACIVLAEGIAGSEANFADMLNVKAKEIGMLNSNFKNASGWPDPDHYSTARDLSMLGLYLIQHYADHYHYYAEKDFTYHGIKQGNRNPLLYANIGADGIKTGHAEDAGYGLIGSAVQNGLRLIMVVNGLSSMKERQEESIKLMSWGFREFTSLPLLTAGQEIDNVPVWLGTAASVPAVVESDSKIMIRRGDRDGVKLTFVSNQPVAAPIAKGQELGIVKIEAPGQKPREVKVVAGADVAKLGPAQKIMAALRYLLLGHN